MTVAGQAVDLHFTECQEQFEHDGVEMRARGADPSSPDHDPVLEVVLTEVGADEPEGESGDMDTVAFDIVC